MICRCGGTGMAYREKYGNALLRWKQCGSCDRCGYFELTIAGLRVETGEAARLAYRAIRQPETTAMAKP